MKQRKISSILTTHINNVESLLSLIILHKVLLSCFFKRFLIVTLWNLLE
jgi:hypothetical protein